MTEPKPGPALSAMPPEEGAAVEAMLDAIDDETWVALGGSLEAESA